MILARGMGKFFSEALKNKDKSLWIIYTLHDSNVQRNIAFKTENEMKNWIKEHKSLIIEIEKAKVTLVKGSLKLFSKKISNRITENPF